ncbi:MAG: NB-ARC domain-containing protein [Anaerolineae bacterium]
MSPPSKERQRLLQQAVFGFAQAHPDYTMARIEQEIAETVGLSRSSVQKWRAGHPIAPHHVPTLVEWAVREAGMDPVWLRSFLRQCDYGSIHLETQLFSASEDEEEKTSPAEMTTPVLPSPEYLRLFGVEPLVQRLVAQLTDPQGPRFISVEGLGGIGKTALAHAVAQRLTEETSRLESLCWISARHAWINPRGELTLLNDPARSASDVVTRLAEQLGLSHLTGLAMSDKLAHLRPLLQENPHLIVVDNLETLADVQALLPALQPLAGATRFLFTSRQTLRHYPYVHVLSVPRLSAEDSEALLRSEMERRDHPLNLPPHVFSDLYQLIGGVPLALKLTAAQLGRLPMEQLLTDLRRADRRTPQAMYTYIYHRTWRQLQEPARELLLTLLNVAPEGEDLTWIRLLSTLTSTRFEAALAQLLDYSLLEVTRTLPQPVYRLHRLTVTFLQSEILLDWKDEDRRP